MSGNNVRFGAYMDDHVSGTMGKIKGAFDEVRKSQGFAAAVQGVGIGAGIAAWGGLTHAVSSAKEKLQETVHAGEAAEATNARLQASLKANVVGWDGNVDAIDKVIRARRALGFTDLEQKDALAGLVGATHDVNKALDIERTAMDLARFKHISLGEAVAALTKVEAGSYKMLKSLGIVLKDGATQTDALAAVQAVASGQAEDYGKTTEGAVDRMKASFDALKEKIRTAALPIVTKLADAATNLSDQFEGLLPVIGGLGLVIQSGLAPSMMTAVFAAARLSPALVGLGTAIRGAVLGPLGLLIGALALVAIGVAKSVTDTRPHIQQLQEAIEAGVAPPGLQQHMEAELAALRADWQHFVGDLTTFIQSMPIVRVSENLVGKAVAGMQAGLKSGKFAIRDGALVMANEIPGAIDHAGAQAELDISAHIKGMLQIIAAHQNDFLNAAQAVADDTWDPQIAKANLTIEQLALADKGLIKRLHSKDATIRAAAALEVLDHKKKIAELKAQITAYGMFLKQKTDLDLKGQSVIQHQHQVQQLADQGKFLNNERDNFHDHAQQGLTLGQKMGDLWGKGVIAFLEKHKAGIASAAADAAAGLNMTVTVGGHAGGGRKGHAGGGFVPPGESSDVGELGVEGIYAVPGGGVQVASRSTRRTGGRGGGGDIHLHISSVWPATRAQIKAIYDELAHYEYTQPVSGSGNRF